MFGVCLFQLFVRISSILCCCLLGFLMGLFSSRLFCGRFGRNGLRGCQGYKFRWKVGDRNQGQQKQAKLTLLHNHHFQGVRCPLIRRKYRRFVWNIFQLNLSGWQMGRARQKTDHAHFQPNNMDWGTRKSATWDSWQKIYSAI